MMLQPLIFALNPEVTVSLVKYKSESHTQIKHVEFEASTTGAVMMPSE
ncbi:hypothetical protein [Pontibacter ruber]|uniref:Uncharacterized protein n=1 Tax=Pontibacter ruber TaxID=1343895 RepID=A0ABW5CYV7_9BACT|nr:hypothetical protein [Pontibacter ruber]